MPAYSVTVIANTSVSDLSLTTSQLRRIYTMRQSRWGDNRVITVFVLPSKHVLHQQFTKERLHIFPYQLDRVWHKLTYSGLGTAPITVETPEALIQEVMKTPGAIGYVDDVIIIKIKEEGAVNVIDIKR